MKLLLATNSLIILIAMLLTGCAKRTQTLDSASMEPTILKGSSVTVDYSFYDANPIERFDIVVFEPASDPHRLFVFRVAGLPNEKIQLTGDGVLINDTAITFPNDIQYNDIILDNQKVRIDEAELKRDEYFLLGDNTKHANDSRFVGPIKRSKILGIVVDIQQVSGENGRKLK